MIFSLIFISLVSCTSEEIYFELKKTNGSWHKDSIYEFTFEAQDTINKYDVFIHLRNTEIYKYNNLFVVTALHYPKGKVEVDTLEYNMAYPNGMLMGEGIGSLKYNKLWYKEDYTFSEPGVYKFEIRQAMREYNNTKPLKELVGVEEVGLSYEPQIKSNND